jgi:uncharacterized protein (TIGR02996 family)
MTEREALLRAVCEFPNDDTPRLVFADWLQEHDEEARAEFIRAQVETEWVSLNNAAGERLFFRERELLRVHETSWRAALPTPFFSHPFVRGFVEAATIGEHRPFQISELQGLFASSPLVDLSIYQLSDPGALAGIPETSRLRTLLIGLMDPRDESIERFLTKTDLRRLQSLTVYEGGGIIYPHRALTEPRLARFRERFKQILVLPRRD